MIRTVRLRSRWDDCDRYGHVNNAAFLSLARAAHDRAGLPTGRLRALEISYRQPLPPDTNIDARVEVVERGESSLRVQYALAVDGRSCADVTALWQLDAEPVGEELPPIVRDAGGLPFRFHQTVRS